jgi:hypothetical protein
MEYEIEVDFVFGISRVTYYRISQKPFECPGNAIDACNFRVKQILDNSENGITKSNLIAARIYVGEKKVLDVNYRENKLELSDSIERNNFWIKR